MKTIAITSHGTLGDNLPLIALGQSLQQRGHNIIMVISPPMHSYALKVGLQVAANGDILGKEEAKQKSKIWNHLNGKNTIIDESYYHKFQSNLQNKLSYLLDACKDVDGIILSSQQNFVAGIVPEKLDIPWIRASVTPSLQCRESTTKNRDKLDDNIEFSSKIHEILAKTRQSVGLLPSPSMGWDKYFYSQHFLLGSSSYFSQPTTKYTHAVQTGFWFYENPEWADWQPDRKLKDFMTQKPKPLVLSFSSLPLSESDARAVVEVHVRAAAKLNRPILIQQGWADFTADLLPENGDRDRVMFVGFMPQDWLFSQAAALIHHGGIGTTARALRNGCPMLVEPYGNDQFFNAKQIILHGVGAAIHPVGLQVDELVRVLRDKVLTPEYKQRAEEMGAKIRAEAGLQKACDSIESWIGVDDKLNQSNFSEQKL